MIILNCPHCRQYIVVDECEINCGIFRHGVYKSNFTQVHPHAVKEVCDYISSNNLIYGCGKPFQISKENDIFMITKCNYI